MNRIWTQSLLAMALVVSMSAAYADDVTAPTAPVVKKHKKTKKQIAEEKAAIEAEKATPIPVKEVGGPVQNAPAGAVDDPDQLITNAKMRAESGSKSRYSFRSKVNYYGGALNQPFAAVRPNIGAAPGQTAFGQFTGELSGKYLIDTKRSLAAGVGFRYITPFQGIDKPKQNYDGDKMDLDNPYIYYQYLTKWRGIQVVLSAQPTLITRSDQVAIHHLAEGIFTGTLLYDIGTTHLSAGLYGEIDYNVYYKNSDDDNDYSAGLDPFLEYQINDRLNIRTVFNLWNYDHERSRPLSLWSHENLIQSFGLGISVTRDVFLYPNVQFVLDKIRMDRTNFAINMAINLW
jgi:hypothetical protein